jgi:hypothetical protein
LLLDALGVAREQQREPGATSGGIVLARDGLQGGQPAGGEAAEAEDGAQAFGIAGVERGLLGLGPVRDGACATERHPRGGAARAGAARIRQGRAREARRPVGEAEGRVALQQLPPRIVLLRAHTPRHGGGRDAERQARARQSFEMAHGFSPSLSAARGAGSKRPRIRLGASRRPRRKRGHEQELAMQQFSHARHRQPSAVPSRSERGPP